MTVIPNILSSNVVDNLASRADLLIASGAIQLVNHVGKGDLEVSDLGGKYHHHIFKGDDVRLHFQELVAVYSALTPLISLLTARNAITSPYEMSDINIKAYPAGGGTLGKHYDSNTITALLFLSTNSEAPLKMYIERKHPSKPEGWIEEKEVYAVKGALLLLKGREILHECEATKNERKLTVVLNYYTPEDTYRNEKFDKFVYEGISAHEQTISRPQ